MYHRSVEFIRFLVVICVMHGLLLTLLLATNVHFLGTQTVAAVRCVTFKDVGLEPKLFKVILNIKTRYLNVIVYLSAARSSSVLLSQVIKIPQS